MAKRSELWLYKEVSPGLLALGGLLLIGGLGLHADPFIRGAVALLAIATTLGLGGRIRVIPNLIILISLTVMYLLNPFGKVLFSIGSFPITLGALERGLNRAFLLIALLYISRLYISPKLRFPGYFGSLLSKTLRSFEMLQESTHPIHPKSFIRDIDTRLLEVEERLVLEAEAPVDNSPKERIEGTQTPLAAITGSTSATTQNSATSLRGNIASLRGALFVSGSLILGLGLILFNWLR